MNKEVTFKLNEEMLNNIANTENDFINKKDVINIVEQINAIDKKHIVVVIDSNFNITHAKSVSGIIETNLKNEGLNNYYSMFFVPKNMDFNKLEQILLGLKAFPNSINKRIDEILLNNLDYYNIFDKINDDKIVFINESFGIKNVFKKDDVLTLDNVNNFKKKINLLEVEAKETIKFLNENKNITIVKSAGNNIKDKNGIQINIKLKDIFDLLTSNNYENTKVLTFYLNKCINEKINNKILDNELIDFLKSLKLTLNELNINYNEFINLYIKDYLIHYEKTALLKETINLKNDNLFIVEAINYDKILSNYLDYKKYLNENKIDDRNMANFEKDFNNLNIQISQVYNQKEIQNIKELYNKYKDELPEIFKYSSYGTFSNLIYENNKSLKTSIEGHSSYFNNENKIFLGSSSSTPEFTSDFIIQKIKSDILNFELENNIKELY